MIIRGRTVGKGDKIEFSSYEPPQVSIRREVLGGGVEQLWGGARGMSFLSHLMKVREMPKKFHVGNCCIETKTDSKVIL